MNIPDSPNFAKLPPEAISNGEILPQGESKEPQEITRRGVVLSILAGVGIGLTTASVVAPTQETAIVVQDTSHLDTYPMPTREPNYIVVLPTEEITGEE